MSIRCLALMSPLFLFAATLAPAQEGEQDKAALKKRILQEVEKRLRAEEERILSEIEKLIEDEFSKLREGRPAEPRKQAQDKPRPARRVRGYLGIKPAQVSEDEQGQLGDSVGVKIAGVVEGGPAAAAGVRDGDIVIGIDGKDFERPEEFIEKLQTSGKGTTLKLSIWRAGERQELSVTLAGHPEDEEAVEPPAGQPGPSPKSEEELRERMKKFLDKKPGEPQGRPDRPRGTPKPESNPLEDMLALDDAMLDQIRPMLEQSGVDPEMFLEKGEDGKWRLAEGMKDMLGGMLEGLQDQGADGLDQLLALDENMMEQIKPMLEQLGIPAEMVFEEGDDGRYRLSEFAKGMAQQALKSLFPDKDFNLPLGPKSKPKKESKREQSKQDAEKPVKSAWLGVEIEELDEAMRSQLGLSEEDGGILITGIKPGSPAAEAGLKKNDVLLGLGDAKIVREGDLLKFIKSARPGQSVDAKILREGDDTSVKVTLGEKP